MTSRLRAPVAIVLGAPADTADIVEQIEPLRPTCYQMDHFPAERLRHELAARDCTADVAVAPDLWDLPAEHESVLYVAPKGGERDLKIDMVEQAFHILRSKGVLLVVSPFVRDQFFPALLKKIFGAVHGDTTGDESVYWCRRERERKRRRHEVVFQARVGDDTLRFLSRPGVFSYADFDQGARALVETMEIQPGQRVLDLGCGCGTNGICAGKRAGPTGHVTFVDSNARAVALAEHNARANGLTAFEVVASVDAEGLPENSFDVALANPPYYAQAAIAHRFIDRCRSLLRPHGSMYLVTKQADQVAVEIESAFTAVEVSLCRGYHVFRAATPR